MTDTYDPSIGVILDYSAMTPLPIIKYDSETNAIVFNNPIVPAVGSQFKTLDRTYNLHHLLYLIKQYRWVIKQILCLCLFQLVQLI